MTQFRFVGSLVVAVILACTPVPSWGQAIAPEAELARAEAVWSSLKPAEYQYTIRFTCGLCPVSAPDAPPLLFRVRGDRDTGEMFRYYPSYSTIDKIFALIRTEIAKTPHRVEIEYDQTLGYPRRVFIDPVINLCDEEMAFEVVDFEAVHNHGQAALRQHRSTAPADSHARLEGVVTVDEVPLPGAVVAVDGIGIDDTSIANEQGRYAFESLPPGAYMLSVALPGFRAATRRLTLVGGSAVTLDVPLQVDRLAEVDHFVPDARTALRQATAVAHVRIDSTVAPANCENSVVAVHRAAVISIVKGQLPPSIWLVQAHAGSCFDLGQLVRAGTPYQAGEEYIAFLRATDDAFSSLAGPGTFVRVKGGRVVDQYPPIKEGMVCRRSVGSLVEDPVMAQPFAPTEAAKPPRPDERSEARRRPDEGLTSAARPAVGLTTPPKPLGVRAGRRRGGLTVSAAQAAFPR